jgi:lactobin A/cerein 7B family class IIb bacteriocin
MKNLDLNGFGVQEMNAGEMRATEGGIIPLLVALVVGAIIAVVGVAVALGASVTVNGNQVQ